MENNMEINDFFQLKFPHSAFGANIPICVGYITFSNSNRNGNPKFFDIGLLALITTLKNLKDKADSFEIKYHEDLWRNAVKLYFEDPVAKTLAATQTKPFFSLLSKLIIWANPDSLGEIDPDDDISLEQNFLDATIAKVEALAERLTIDSKQKTNGEVVPGATSSELCGENIIFYGAPGTGKSYEANKYANIVRTVFHSDTLTHDFIGSYKPYVDAGSITYRFVPGPFIDALVKAHVSINTQVTLVIEEINRANAGAVFGEFFQLLDRNAAGESEYSIAVEQPLYDYLKSKNVLSENEIKIPPNLFIIATMNSADQGVFPMDSAFRRRWSFRYCAIDFTKLPLSYQGAQINYAGQSYSWSEFAQGINRQLGKININEDKMIGPFFLKENEVGDNQKIASKLLIYLWDDVVRHNRSQLFNDRHNQFSSVEESFNKCEKIFTFDINQ